MKKNLQLENIEVEVKIDLCKKLINAYVYVPIVIEKFMQD